MKRIVVSLVVSVLMAMMVAVPVFGQTTTTATLVGAGDIARCTLENNAEATAALLEDIPGTVYTIGDNVQGDGRRIEFARCYDNFRLSDGSIYDTSRTTYWGQDEQDDPLETPDDIKARTMPSLGNHEYLTEGAQPYFDYFSAQNGFEIGTVPSPVPNTPNNPGLTPGKGYYSYDRGNWHIVALNSNCSKVGGCGKNSTQGKWLKNNLANTTNQQCTLAYFHHALYTSGNNAASPEVKPLWNMLYAEGAEVILSGHGHRYERYAPMTPAGVLDTQNGIRQFVVGTGGEPGGDEVHLDNAPNLEVVKTGTSGVLKLDLSAGSYSWEFVPIAGQTFTDSGSGSCH
jgi:acid phosphatase type 7